MNKIGRIYGKWLGETNWNYIATIRPHYKLTEFSSEEMFSKLIDKPGVKRVFFALEKDTNPNMFHAHLMLQTDIQLTREKLANMLDRNIKTVSYFQRVINPKAVSIYCTKHITYNFSHYSFY